MGGNVANSGFWLTEHEDAGGAVAFVFVVVSFGFLWFHGQGEAGFQGRAARAVRPYRPLECQDHMGDDRAIARLPLLLRSRHPAPRG